MIEFSSNELIDEYLDRDKLELFISEVLQANRVFNLVSRNSSRKDLELLIAESLIPVNLGWFDDNAGPILDIGSGWGVPAIPMLISNPELTISLVERSQKKADFLLLLLHRLGLKADVICKDLSGVSNNTLFSSITLRGVSVDNKLQKHLKRLSAPGGILIYFGSNLPGDFLDSSQIIEYSIDNLPVRKLIKYPIS